MTAISLEILKLSMSEIQQQMAVAAPLNPNPVHPNAKSTTHVNNGTTTTKTNITSPVCRNCKTQTTPLWRRDETGQVLCNACGLFLKLHGRPRPISLKTDTIKSRNRIKQSNSSKNSTPNTPELKSKDSKPNGNSGKKSPKMKKKNSMNELLAGEEPTSLTPLLPPTSSLGSQPNGLVFAHPSGSANPLSNHLQQHAQPLHYPSSTPTHFAPGLQRITSPLLLSTTSSVSNARSTNASIEGNMSAVQAAGALENMSNELGPSATFKGKNGVLPMNKGIDGPLVKELEKSFSTPSSALNANSTSHIASAKLPALSSSDHSKTILSPSFGPQFHFQSSRPQSPQASNTSTASTSITQLQSPNVTPLPPIHHVASQVGEIMPSFQKLGPYGHKLHSTGHTYQANDIGRELPHHHRKYNDDDKSERSNRGNNENSGDSFQDKNNRDRRDDEHKANEVNVLKTRISELELVNDLYRTRIMELEAMEQAARMREASLRKLLDGYYNFLEYGIPMKREPEDNLAYRNKRSKVEN